MQEIESYLFIGGIKDGEWYNLPTNYLDYHFAVLKHERVSYAKDVPESMTWEDKYDVRYIKVKIGRTYRPDQKDLWVYISEDIYNTGTYTQDTIFDIICKLVNNYKVIK